MTDLSVTDELFYDRAGLDRVRVGQLVDDALSGADDGELFLEYRQSEALAFDDGRLRHASFDTNVGFGLRAVAGETRGFAHATVLSQDALRRAAATVRAVHAGHGGTASADPEGTNQAFYTGENPIRGVGFARKVAVLQEIDAYARTREPRVRQVMTSLLTSRSVSSA